MSNINELRSLYRYLITHLKIMYMRAEHNGEKINAERYKKAYERLEIINERRHLNLIGEKGKEREAYQKTLQMIEERYINKEDEILEVMIDEIDVICKEYRNRNKERKKRAQGKNRRIRNLIFNLNYIRLDNDNIKEKEE